MYKNPASVSAYSSRYVMCTVNCIDECVKDEGVFLPQDYKELSVWANNLQKKFSCAIMNLV